MRIVFLLFTALFLASCGSGGGETTPSVRPVKCIVVASTKFVNKDFAGLSTADDATNMAFKISGQVKSIPVSKGQAVKRGQLLAELDPRDVELQVESARAAYNQASSRLERARRLLSHDAISRQEAEAAQTDYTQAKSAYDNAKDLLSDTRLTAPFDGVVERTYADAYERVASGQTIVRIVNPVSTTVEFTAPESMLGQLSMPATHFGVTFDSYRGVRFEAVMKSYARTSSDASGFPVSLRLVDVDSGRYAISPGMTCVITVSTAESDRDAVSVPISAIYAPASGGNFVWTVDSDDRVTSRAVMLGEIFGDDMVVVDSGLEPGERVVVAGVYQLSDGEKVRVMNQ